MQYGIKPSRLLRARLIDLVVKGVELLISEFEHEGPTDGFMSVVVALMFFFTVYVLELVRKGIWFRPWVRAFLGDYAYPVSPIKAYMNRGLVSSSRFDR